MIAEFSNREVCVEHGAPSENLEIEAEWFQLTNHGLRKSPDGEFVAILNSEQDWELTDTLTTYSDIVIHEAAPRE